MTVSQFLITTGVLVEGCIWIAFFKTSVSQRLLSKISFISGSTVLFGLVGYLADLY